MFKILTLKPAPRATRSTTVPRLRWEPLVPAPLPAGP